MIGINMTFGWGSKLVGALTGGLCSRRVELTTSVYLSQPPNTGLSWVPTLRFIYEDGRAGLKVCMTTRCVNILINSIASPWRAFVLASASSIALNHNLQRKGTISRRCSNGVRSVDHSPVLYIKKVSTIWYSGKVQENHRLDGLSA